MHFAITITMNNFKVIKQPSRSALQPWNVQINVTIIISSTARFQNITDYKIPTFCELYARATLAESSRPELSNNYDRSVKSNYITRYHYVRSNFKVIE